MIVSFHGAMVCCMAAMASLPAEEYPPDSVRLVPEFDLKAFMEPESLLWPGPFWLWNAPLDPERLRTHLSEMASHGFRSVCMLPMPHAFRPDSTNNLLDPDYLTPAFMDRTRLAVEEAASLGMHWWLYDEGGWPSGQALGKVAEGHPEYVQHTMVREPIEPAAYTVPADAFALVVENTGQIVRPGETWAPRAGDRAYLYRVRRGGYADLLNPHAMRRFIKLTHEAYRAALEPHLGKTVKFTFTDEPNVPNLNPPKSITWTPGMDELYRTRYGRDIAGILPLLFSLPGKEAPLEVARARIEYYDLWTARFRDAYFIQIRDWCRRAGLASGGHLNGEDETINAVRYGFGHALRQLRAMDVPGVDVIWRQLFPGKDNPHFFPKYASSAAHQNGTRFAFSESFCVYGNGITPAQAKWVMDYQLVRGINLFVVGCMPLTTRDHHMTGERPHFGPVDPLWDSETALWEYAARMGCLFSSGTPGIRTALYYPVRDMWALGLEATEAVESHDQLARELLATQRDFDLLDDDLLIDPATHVDGRQLVAGAMRYDTVVCGKVCWMHPDSLERLRAFAAAGGQAVYFGHLPGTDGTPGEAKPAFPSIESAVAAIPATAVLMPQSRSIRVASRRVEGGEILMLFNEGAEFYKGELFVDAPYLYTFSISRGCMLSMPTEKGRIGVELEPGQTRVFFMTNRKYDVEPVYRYSGDGMVLDERIHAKPYRRYVAGEHDFEIIPQNAPSVSFAQAKSWKNWLGEDFSGQADYTASFELPKAWEGKILQLSTGPVEYAAQVFMDGKLAGSILAPPWQAELPPVAAGTHQITIRVANTLANELTSERVVIAWAGKSGPGWPSPYHKRAIEFEKESRGGGLQGPIRLFALFR